MVKQLNWNAYVDADNNFELPTYLFRVFMHLMKTTLDFGTLLSNDPARLRAFKEQTKSTFKNRWLEVAQALEAFEIIVPCNCMHSEYCSVCKGSRYLMNEALSPDQMREISVVIAPGQDRALAEKLEMGLEKAFDELDVLGI